MKISKKHIPYTFKESKRIFENNLSVKEAAENINKKCGIKITSAADYPYYYRYLITGTGSCRSLSSFTQEYFLRNIFEDTINDIEQKKNILLYFKKLIEKFEKGKVGSKKSMNAIYEKYRKLV